jgi:hypothetical protein
LPAEAERWQTAEADIENGGPGMGQAWQWRGLAVIALATGLGLTGCAQSSPPRTSPSSLDCLLGPDTGRPECANLDDDPEQCVLAGGIFDAETQRCLR